MTPASYMHGRPRGVVVSPSLGSRPRSLRPFHLQRPPFDPRLPLVLVGTERLVAGLSRTCAGVGDTTGACVGEAGALFVRGWVHSARGRSLGGMKTSSSSIQSRGRQRANSIRRGSRQWRQPSERDPARTCRARQAAVTNGWAENAPQPDRTNGRSPRALSTGNRTGIGTQCHG